MFLGAWSEWWLIPPPGRKNPKCQNCVSGYSVLGNPRLGRRKNPKCQKRVRVCWLTLGGDVTGEKILSVKTAFRARVGRKNLKCLNTVVTFRPLRKPSSYDSILPKTWSQTKSHMLNPYLKSELSCEVSFESRNFFEFFEYRFFQDLTNFLTSDWLETGFIGFSIKFCTR